MAGWSWGREIDGNERLRIAVGSFLVVTTLSFGGNLGGFGTLIWVLGLAVALGIVGPVWFVHGKLRFPRMDVLTASGIWASVTFGIFVMGLGGRGIMLSSMGWFFASAVLVVMILWALFTKWRKTAGATAVVCVTVCIAFLLAPFHLVFRNAQVRVGESTLRADMENGDSYRQSEGVHGWIWLGGAPDGGTGVAFDPSDRLLDDDFARDTWASITGDTGRCESLYGHWYWCGG